MSDRPRYLPTPEELARQVAALERERLQSAPDERSRPRLPRVYREPRGLLEPTRERVD